jgi:hypothetical protein
MLTYGAEPVGYRGASLELQGAVQTLSSAAHGDEEKERLLFPHGIELIDVDVKVAGVEVKLKIAGPKPPQS